MSINSDKDVSYLPNEAVVHNNMPPFWQFKIYYEYYRYKIKKFKCYIKSFFFFNYKDENSYFITFHYINFFNK